MDQGFKSVIFHQFWPSIHLSLTFINQCFQSRPILLFWSYQACNYSFKLVTCMSINLAHDKIKLLKNLEGFNFYNPAFSIKAHFLILIINHATTMTNRQLAYLLSFDKSFYAVGYIKTKKIRALFSCFLKIFKIHMTC